MKIQDIIDHIPEYKVIETGKIFEAICIDYEDELIFYESGRGLGFDYGFDKVQKMTPLSFNGERIGIGDTVKIQYGEEMIVYDYYYDFIDKKWLIQASTFNSARSNYYAHEEIESHTLLHPTKAKEVTMKEVEEKFGVRIKIIK